MPYEIVVQDVAARPIAAVHANVSLGGVATAWRPALDKVWAFLRSVEVSRAFADEGEIVFTHTPAGQAAATVHVGRPDQLAGANAAIEEWCRANDRSLAGVSWEIYGDPGDDQAIFEVQVFYLLG